MAERNFWVIEDGAVKKGVVQFDGVFGTQPEQRMKSCISLHKALGLDYGLRAIDISTASYLPFGVALAASNLLLEDRSIEMWFLGSMVFEDGYCAHELYDESVRKATAAIRKHKNHVGFDFNGLKLSSDLSITFFDWIYLIAMVNEYGRELSFNRFDAFTDSQTKNNDCHCAARAVCEYVLLQQEGSWELLQNFQNFADWHADRVDLELNKERDIHKVTISGNRIFTSCDVNVLHNILSGKGVETEIENDYTLKILNEDLSLSEPNMI